MHIAYAPCYFQVGDPQIFPVYLACFHLWYLGFQFPVKISAVKLQPIWIRFFSSFFSGGIFEDPNKELSGKLFDVQLLILLNWTAPSPKRSFGLHHHYLFERLVCNKLSLTTCAGGSEKGKRGFKHRISVITMLRTHMMGRG